MLKDVVIHIPNEQALLADLPVEPSSTDVCLICTNLRTMNGQTPVFVERRDSMFVFPMAHVRFLEIRPGSNSEPTDESGHAAVPSHGATGPAELVKSPKRLGGGRSSGADVPDVADGDADIGGDGPDVVDDDDPDEFIRRIRAI